MTSTQHTGHFLAQAAKALKALQTLTGDQSLAQRVESGRFQLVRVTYDKAGRGEVRELGPWIATRGWLQYLAGDALKDARK